ncbi:MAG: phytoene/squalene synthase family protein [Clostridia bacterium]
MLPLTTMPGPTPPDVRAAYQACRRLMRSHYENFMIASVFTPSKLRPAMWALYAYARTVDDLGDEAEGDRLVLLDGFEADLRACFAGERETALFVALGDAVDRLQLPLGPFLALIDANRRDQDPTPFADFGAIESYCQGSANSVGRLVLRIFGYDDPALDHLSACTTTALQLVNFYQDLRHDAARGRLYLPLDELKRFGVDREDLQAAVMGDHLADLLRASYGRVRALFAEGQALETRVDRHLRRQLQLYRLGGSAILDALEANLERRSLSRPALSSAAKLKLLGQVFLGTGGGRRNDA